MELGVALRVRAKGLTFRLSAGSSLGAGEVLECVRARGRPGV